MKKIVLFAFALSATILTMAQNPMSAAADKGLNNFRKIVLMQSSKENPVAAADTAGLRLGNPVQTAIIPLDKLKEYKTGDAPAPFITDVNEFVYPVINSRTNKITGSVTVSKSKENWVPSRYGSENQLTQERASALLTQNEHQYKLVKLLALQMNFLSYEESGITRFVPLQQDSGRKVEMGKAMDAKEVLDTYSQVLRNYNGLPM